MPLQQELDALKEALVAALPSGPGVRVVERPGWVQVINPDAKSVFGNTVYISEFPAADENSVDAGIDAVIEEYGRIGKPFRWITGPWSSPTDLGERLLRRGFSLGRECFGMTRSSEVETTPSDPRMTIEVVDKGGAEDWARTFCRSWELPEEALAGQRAYTERSMADPRISNLLARWEGVPFAVATTASLHSSAYFSNSAVIMEFRGRGAFRKLVEHHCRSASARGQALASVYAFKDTSFPILERMGFTVACECPQYFYPPG